MDTLVKEALRKVNEAVEAIPWGEIKQTRENLNPESAADFSSDIAHSIRAIDALRAALRAI